MWLVKKRYVSSTAKIRNSQQEILNMIPEKVLRLIKRL